uniref:Retrotransposon gag domain-containing protein n=1 Tax=Triticum urartu TaxID=4572 RepID=A0A8R7VIA3_TRIUA
MEPPIREQVETMTTIFEVWKALEKQFSGKSNKMQATRIMHELTNLKQGSKSVTEYAGEMKRLYRELHYYHPFEPVDKNDMAVHHTWFEPFVGKLFLDGLNQEFDLRRQLIFSKTEWLSLDDIISSVIEKETRLAQPKEHGQEKSDARAALSIQAHRAPKSFGKIRLSEDLSSSQDSSKVESSFHATSHKGARDRETIGDWDRA